MTDAAFWDRIAPRYAKSPVADPDAYEATLTRVRTYLGPQSQVLEMGCGTGSTALKLYENAGLYEATDISAGMIEIANSKLEGLEGAKPVFRVAGVNADDYAGRTYDTVMAFNLMHLVPDLEAMLDDVHRMLPEGGLFISKTPALSEKWYYRPVIGFMRLIGKAPFVRLLGIDEMDRMIEKAGFRIVETGLFGNTPGRFVVARKV